ncbi:hypothetical protein [Flavobacterium sp.]|uniref:LIC_10190 family membrane protein n=1 Tax=Flavobacterium sp. TaxID=239 RepID=UPI0011F9492A|nr:hypothetical protein [Flavobacterium sp.]RZJ72301.1 MAG: hypothetical protein EOO49_07575 [Flavobacterium sp.]
MLLIALSFVYIVFTTVNFGACANSLFKTKTSDFTTISILGLFAITVIASFWAIFGRINWEFHTALLVLNIVLFFVFRNAVVANFRLLKIRFSKLPKSLKLLFAVNAILILAKSAAAPYILDNESYYIQTIKWLNEFGFVKGLANLHIFLAQMSGWHIAQSAFSFSFLYPNFNDLSGFCLLIANLYSVFRLLDFLETKSKVALTMGLLPIANVFLLQFSGAPAADIPVFVLTFLALDVFFCHFQTPTKANFTLLALLVLFALYIKITVLALVILPIWLLLSDFRNLISKRIFFAGLTVFALFITKNIIVSGQALFPLPYQFGFETDYAVPRQVADFFFVESRPFPFGLTKQQYDAMPFWEIFVRWMRLPKLHGFFNTIGVLLALLSPIFIARFYPKKPMWIAYLTMVVQFFLLLWLSPQYRFFTNFILFFGMFCVGCIVQNKKAIFGMLTFGTIAASILVFVPLKLDSVTDNKLANKTTALSFRNVIWPHPNSRNDRSCTGQMIGNLYYHSPLHSDFFWNTGDVFLPAVNSGQLDFFAKRFGIRPQLRKKDLSDGFRSEMIPKVDATLE